MHKNLLIAVTMTACLLMLSGCHNKRAIVGQQSVSYVMTGNQAFQANKYADYKLGKHLAVRPATQPQQPNYSEWRQRGYGTLAKPQTEVILSLNKNGTYAKETYMQDAKHPHNIDGNYIFMYFESGKWYNQHPSRRDKFAGIQLASTWGRAIEVHRRAVLLGVTFYHSRTMISTVPLTQNDTITKPMWFQQIGNDESLSWYSLRPTSLIKPMSGIAIHNIKADYHRAKVASLRGAKHEDWVHDSHTYHLD